MIRPLASLVLAVSALLVASGRADACTCQPSGPPCQAYWKSDVVLDATVLAVSQTSRAETRGSINVAFSDTLVTLKVHRAWKGLDSRPGTEVEIVTASDGAACGYKFEEGRRYLIFGYSRTGQGRIVVSSCSATTPFDGTGDAAAFLASLDAPSAGARLFGQVTLSEQHLDWNRNAVREPLDGIPVVLHGPGGRRETTTRRGRYEFVALPAGTYDVEVRLPEGLDQQYTTSSMELPDVHACGEVDFWTRSDGRIQGQVLAGGQPAPDVQVEVMVAGAAPTRVGQGSTSARTDAAGFYTIPGLPPGRYVVGVNLRFGFRTESPYPRTYHRISEGSEPTVVELGRGESAALAPLLLPAPARAITLTGTAVWSDGTPVSEGDVFASDVTDTRRTIAGGAGLDSSGRFSLELREGRNYVIEVRAYERGTRTVIATGRSAVIRGSVEIAPLRLVAQRRSPGN